MNVMNIAASAGFLLAIGSAGAAEVHDWRKVEQIKAELTRAIHNIETLEAENRAGSRGLLEKARNHVKDAERELHEAIEAIRNASGGSGSSSGSSSGSAPASGAGSLSISEDQFRKKDLSVLNGTWKSITSLYSSISHRPVVQEYKFNHKGMGEMTILQENAPPCRAPTVARYDGDHKLVIENTAEAACPTGRPYARAVVTCTVTKGGGRAACSGVQTTGVSYSVELRR